MEAEKNDDVQTEIHSEKVRKLLGDIPSALTSWGGLVILMIFIALMMVLVFTPYPHSPYGESILTHILYPILWPDSPPL